MLINEKSVWQVDRKHKVYWAILVLTSMVMNYDELLRTHQRE